MAKLKEAYSKMGETRRKAAAVEARARAAADEAAGRASGLAEKLSEPWRAVQSDALVAKQRQESAASGLGPELTAELAPVESRLRAKAQLTPDARVKANLLTDRIRALRSTATSRTSALQAELGAKVRPALEQAAAGLAASAQDAERLASEVKAIAPPVVAAAGQLRRSLDATFDETTKQIRSGVGTLRASLTACRTEIERAAGQVGTSIDQGEQVAAEAASSAKARLFGLLDAPARAIDETERVFLAAVDAVRAQLDQIEAGIRTSAEEANHALDAVGTQGATKLQAFATQVEALTGTASEQLANMRGLIAGLRADVMPAIEALPEVLGQLQTLYGTGVQLLNGVLQAATGVLEAIQAKGLPKPLVQPAMTAIKSGVDAALPQIQNGAQKAGTQLATLATQLSGQVETVKGTALGQVTTFATTMSAQIEAVLPPVLAQVEVIRGQIETLIETITAQVDNMSNAAIAAIEKAKAQAETVVDQLVAQQKTAVATFKTTTEQTVAGVRAQIAQAKGQLAAQLDAQVSTARKAISDLKARFDAELAKLEASIDQAEERFAAQALAANAKAAGQVNSMASRIDELTAQIDARIEAAIAGSAASAASARARIPPEGELQGLVEAERGRHRAECAKLGAEVDALG